MQTEKQLFKETIDAGSAYARQVIKGIRALMDIDTRELREKLGRDFFRDTEA